MKLKEKMAREKANKVPAWSYQEGWNGYVFDAYLEGFEAHKRMVVAFLSKLGLNPDSEFLDLGEEEVE